MATDPVERIRAFEHDTPLSVDPAASLERLAELPPSLDAPYLTVSLDWRSQGEEPGRLPGREPKRSERHAKRNEPGPSRRPAWLQVQRELDEIVKQSGPRGTAFDSLSADVERLQTYLEDELDPAAKGVIVVANHHRGLFEPVALDMPVPTSVTTGAIPSLLQLARATEAQQPYAVVIADQRDTFLWLGSWQTWERGVQFESDDYPRKQKQGGLSAQRYQNRADERVEAFAHAIAEETRRELGEGEGSIPYLIVAADEPMYSALEAEWHPTVKARILGRIHLPVDAAATEVAAEAVPLVAEAERKRDLEMVQSVRDGVGANSLGVAGAEDTLTALQTGQVRALVMNDDFAQTGWADYTYPIFGVGEVPAEHPFGGDVANLMPTSLADECVRLALANEGTVTLIATALPVGEDELKHVPDAEDEPPRPEAALALDSLGGIGAILRYTL